MANQINTTIPGKLHNISPSMLADLIGELDRKAKDADNELKAAKDALKARKIVTATGDLPQTFVLGPLPAGTYRLRYPARLTQAGTFTLLPATGAAPVADNTAAWVQADGRTITIEDVRDHK